jgi:hypothetical protein
MDQQKLEYLRPALIAGAVAGMLSGLPFFSLLNCLCCLWIVGGAALSVKLLANRTPGVLTSSDGAVVGALTGIVASVVHTVLTLAQKPDVETARRVMDWLSSLGLDVPSNVDGILESGSAFRSPGWVLLGLFVTAVMYAIVGALGGIIGVSLFAKKGVPPAPVPPPPTPPQIPPGPTHAP